MQKRQRCNMVGSAKQNQTSVTVLETKRFKTKRQGG